MVIAFTTFFLILSCGKSFLDPFIYFTKVKKFAQNDKFSKVHIFWEGYKILQNLHRRYDWHYIGQIYGGFFGKFCGLLRIYELQQKS